MSALSASTSRMLHDGQMALTIWRSSEIRRPSRCWPPGSCSAAASGRPCGSSRSPSCRAGGHTGRGRSRGRSRRSGRRWRRRARPCGRPHRRHRVGRLQVRRPVALRRRGRDDVPGGIGPHVREAAPVARLRRLAEWRVRELRIEPRAAPPGAARRADVLRGGRRAGGEDREQQDQEPAGVGHGCTGLCPRRATPRPSAATVTVHWKPPLETQSCVIVHPRRSARDPGRAPARGARVSQRWIVSGPIDSGRTGLHRGRSRRPDGPCAGRGRAAGPGREVRRARPAAPRRADGRAMRPASS